MRTPSNPCGPLQTISNPKNVIFVQVYLIINSKRFGFYLSNQNKSNHFSFLQILKIEKSHFYTYKTKTSQMYPITKHFNA